jgi:hypothetical protein
MKTKTYPNILCALLAAFVIMATGAASSAQPTKPNPFDSIVDHVMCYSSPIKFEDSYPMFMIHFNNLVNYEPVQTAGCSVLEIYNVTRNCPIYFYPTELVEYGVLMEGDIYMPMLDGGGPGIWYTPSLTWVYPGPGSLPNQDGDLLRIRFKLPNDIEYESPEFELYAPYIYDPSDPTAPDYYWD